MHRAPDLEVPIQSSLDRLPNIAERGVYYLPWVGTAGQIYLAAVDRFSRQRFMAEVPPGQDPEVAAEELWRLLDFDDPHPVRLMS